ncbi:MULTISPECIES: hypothetical protein [Providencia]|uniref:hypothetical protein n=1 Tax=Providencia TaxID=586 RepID=UPI002989D453|nr:hypothetical protein [Providencia stuartii]WRV53868.1 hypothetical protein VQ573_13140 [Providencia stuartii]
MHSPTKFIDPFGLAGGKGNKGDIDSYYRTMSQEHYDHLMDTGQLKPTYETVISPTQSFSEGYSGVLVRFDLKPNTIEELMTIGVRDKSRVTRQFSDMPFVDSLESSWKSSHAYFKGEKGQLIIGLGDGKALDIFNIWNR